MNHLARAVHDALSGKRSIDQLTETEALALEESLRSLGRARGSVGPQEAWAVSPMAQAGPGPQEAWAVSPMAEAGPGPQEAWAVSPASKTDPSAGEL